jgi:hypothetical protein
MVYLLFFFGVSRVKCNFIANYDADEDKYLDADMVVPEWLR